MSTYYRILADPKEISRWHLESPQCRDQQQIEPWVFISGQKYTGPLNLYASLRRNGIPVDFNFCDFDIIVIARDLKDSLQKLTEDNIQFIPITIESMEESDYEIANIVDVVDCIDETRSEFTKWTKLDGRPDKVGQYRMITKLIITPNKVEGHKFFRVKNWEIAIIVNEDIKKALESRNATGIIFDPVN